MNENIATKLRQWAKKYHTADFIANDPISIPHRHTNALDIEVSAIVTALLSFGNRKQILKKTLFLDELMGNSTYDYVMSKGWDKTFAADDNSSFYRTISHSSMRAIFSRLYQIYTSSTSLEEAMIKTNKQLPMERLCYLFCVTDKSPQKKLNMFLRWMVRQNSPVDFGIWKAFSPSELLIPLDTHVSKVSFELGLTSGCSYSLQNARRITSALSEVFPDDPCLGDFALFGYGADKD